MASGSQDVPIAPLGGVAMPIGSLRGRPELIELHIGQAVAVGPLQAVGLTDHALAKALLLGAARSWVEDLVLERHANRERNHGAAEWRLTVDQMVIAYDCPDGDDQLTARVVTLWRRR